ncbi:MULTISPECIES: hypothetical protein [Clostridium]|uniref:Uncharacterized protein n=1 Tax=Clostridium paridis TaxID=2803863 RepID=A0A937FDD3_9CLOT|nr:MULTISPECIES: hypothetical protein [Clostridium]MBL4930745.1 hypothetical protein [Clostridium paridis]
MKYCTHCNSDRVIERFNMSTGEKTYSCTNCKASFSSTGKKTKTVYEIPDKLAFVKKLKSYGII